jgi:hypothetical protein
MSDPNEPATAYGPPETAAPVHAAQTDSTPASEPMPTVDLSWATTDLIRSENPGRDPEITR